MYHWLHDQKGLFLGGGGGGGGLHRGGLGSVSMQTAPTGNTDIARSVRILLECILVDVKVQSCLCRRDNAD